MSLSIGAYYDYVSQATEMADYMLEWQHINLAKIVF